MKKINTLPELTDRVKWHFWKYVSRQPDEGCWNWLGTKRGRGPRSYFGVRTESGVVVVAAARISYFLHTGVDPVGYCVCHTCDNPVCVNPSHLYTGTQSDNMKDKVSKNRQTKGSMFPNSKVSESDVSRARQLFREGIGINALAVRFGMSGRNMYDIVHGRAWRHVP